VAARARLPNPAVIASGTDRVAVAFEVVFETGSMAASSSDDQNRESDIRRLPRASWASDRGKRDGDSKRAPRPG